MAAKRRIGAKADSTAGPLAHYEGTPFSHYYHPRIGFLHATMILAKVGDLAHFILPDKLLAYAGRSASTYQSAQLQNCYLHLEKRGSRYLRYSLPNANKYVCLW